MRFPGDCTSVSDGKLPANIRYLGREGSTVNRPNNKPISYWMSEVERERSFDSCQVDCV